MRTPLSDLFRWYAIPPSPLHEIVQEAARKAGWTPPWGREEQQIKNKAAGEKSGRMRMGLAEIRRSVLSVARTRLNSKHRREPYSEDSIDALFEEYHSLLAEGAGENCAALAKNDNDLCLLVPLMLKGLSKADRQMTAQFAINVICLSSGWHIRWHDSAGAGAGGPGPTVEDKR
jgi:hypothetical protein